MAFLAPTTRISTSQGRTDEFGLTGSEFDRAIPELYGTHRLSGNLIWADSIREEMVDDVSREGGKGAPRTVTTTTSFQYFIHLAIMFCEGPIESVSRIWGDGRIIYDVNDPSTTVEGLNFRFYGGSDDQQPDSLIEEFVGEDLTPAYRGRCYIVFEDFPLESFGNRIPAITAELTDSRIVSVTDPTFDVTHVAPNGFTVQNLDGDISQEFPDNQGAGIRFNGATNELALPLPIPGNGASNVFLNLIDDTTFVQPVRSDAGTAEIFTRGSSQIIGFIEETGAYVSAAWPNVGNSSTDLFTKSRLSAEVLVQTDEGGRILDGEVIEGSGGPSYFGIETGNGDLSVEGYLVTRLNVADGQRIASLPIPPGAVAIPPERGQGLISPADAFGMFVTSTMYTVVRATAATIGEVVSFEPNDVVPGASSFSFELCMRVDRRTGNMYIQNLIDGTPYIWSVDPTTGAVLWATQVPFVVTGNRPPLDQNGNQLDGEASLGSAGKTFLAGDRWVWVEPFTRNVLSIDLETGEIDDLYDGREVPALFSADANPADSSNPDRLQTRYHWHDPTGKLIAINDQTESAPGPNTGAGIFIHSLGAETTVTGQAGDDLTPAEIIRAVSLDAGLTEDDFEIEGLDQPVAGLKSLVISDRQTASEALGPLLSLLQIDVIESDFRVKFFARGTRPVSFTIPEADLVEVQDNENEAYALAVVRERELPRRFEVSYQDFNNAYQDNQQAADRADTTQFSQRVEDFEYNGALEPDLPRQSAEIALYTRWNERERLRSRLPQRYMLADPGDIIEVQLETGQQVTGRLRRSDLGADHTSDIEQVSEFTDQYISDIVGSSGDNNLQFVTPNPGDTDLFLLDLPLLRDTDSGGQESTISYWAGSGEPVWGGATLLRVVGTTGVETVGRQIADVAFGSLWTAPPDATVLNRFTDESFDISVTRGVDQFSSSDDLTVLAGANVLALVRDDGGCEIIQFADAELIADDTIRVSRLLRGRRGTAPFAKGHLPGGSVVLLRPATVNLFGSSTDVIGSGFEYRGVTSGQAFENATSQQYTDTGRDLQPYAPLNRSATELPSGDIEIELIRATRIGGESDFTMAGDVPLSEQIEQYEIDILDGPNGSVVRTLTSPSQTVTYTSADIIADFGAIPTSLSLISFQISAVVGRGFPGEATLEIT